MYDKHAPVALLSCGDYSPGAVAETIGKGLDLLGGLERIVKPGDRVLLKPNLLIAAKPAKAVTTHPQIVEAAIEAVKDLGATPFVADSPGFGSPRSMFAATGLGEVCERHGVQYGFFEEKTRVDGLEGGRFRRFEVAREALEADCIINLAKAKTHQQLTLTLGVKNLFGCVVGLEKPQWHLRAGHDVDNLARMMAELAVVVDADLTILDGVLGMDGNGPSFGGRAREFGFLALSANPFALDVAIAHLFGLPPRKIPITAAGIELGVSPASIGEVEVLGADPAELKVDDFLIPESRKPTMQLPGFLFRMLKRFFTPRLHVDPRKCIVCNACVEVCPTGAARNEGGRVRIETRDCITCYCCSEVCPQDAIELR